MRTSDFSSIEIPVVAPMPRVSAGRHRHGGGLVVTYTVVHGVAEFLTALTLFSMVPAWSNPGGLVLTYSVVAFGCPLVISLLSSSVMSGISEGRMGLAGTVLLATGMLVGQLSWACVLLLGLGSAMLHISAGTATLKLDRRGTAVGVFESTGAIGLAAGTVLGAGAWDMAARTGWIALGSVVILAGGFAVLTWGTNRDHPGLGATVGGPGMTTPDSVRRWTLASGSGWLPLVVLIVLGIVSVFRGVASFTSPQPWKQGTLLVLVAAVCVMLGRAIGGILVDRFGFLVPTLAGFVGAAVLLSAWPDSTWAGLLGLFFLALPMAGVIVALVRCTSRPSLAFGLAQFFQVPTAFAIGILWGSWAVFATLMLCAALFLVARPRENRRIHDSI